MLRITAEYKIRTNLKNLKDKMRTYRSHSNTMQYTLVSIHLGYYFFLCVIPSQALKALPVELFYEVKI